MVARKPYTSRLLRWSLVATALVVCIDVVAASNVVTGLGDGGSDVAVPMWLYLLTGGAVVGVSALLSMLITDRAFIDAVHGLSYRFPGRGSIRRALATVTGAASLIVLALVIAVGLTGPRVATANLAVLIVFVAGRAGLTMVAYLVGDPWPALDPWRGVAERLPHGFVDYPPRFGVLPAICGLLALIWIEVVFPVTARPTTLTVAVLGYLTYTIAGAVVFSPADWFRYGDPIVVWFRCYGAVAPIQRTDAGLTLQLPGSRLRDDDVLRDLSGVAFVVLLVWELTYSGLIVTPSGARTIGALVGLGLPPTIAYLAMLLGGYALFLGVYWLAATRARRQARTYLTARYLAFRFAPPLLGIAAGYHFAHYAGFTLSLGPALLGAVSNPLSPPIPPRTLVLPGWFGIVEVGSVLAGHLLAVWAAHATSFDLFSGRLQAIRSQFPFVVVMVLYTVVSLWLLSLPTGPPPFVG